MAENLAYKPRNGKYWAYKNRERNVIVSGYLYKGGSTIKNICPFGWRLPKFDDFTILLSNFHDDKIAYEALIEGGQSGFSAVLSGRRESIFPGLGVYYEAISYWSSTPNEPLGFLNVLILQNGFARILTLAQIQWSCSVRCIKATR